MPSISCLGRTVICAIGILTLTGAAARAQVTAPVPPVAPAPTAPVPAPPIAPVPSPVPSEVAACYCLDQAVRTLRVDMDAKAQALNATTQRLADLDAQLARDRPQVNTNNPDSVAHYKVLLEQRDSAYRQSVGPVHADAEQATARYNAHVNEYNARCANRPGIPVFSPQAPLPVTCPPLR